MKLSGWRRGGVTKKETLSAMDKHILKKRYCKLCGDELPFLHGHKPVCNKCMLLKREKSYAKFKNGG